MHWRKNSIIVSLVAVVLMKTVFLYAGRPPYPSTHHACQGQPPNSTDWVYWFWDLDQNTYYASLLARLAFRQDYLPGTYYQNDNFIGGTEAMWPGLPR